MKYIIYKDSYSVVHIVTFDSGIEHKHMAHMVEAQEVLSAGFVGIDRNGPYCHGKSLSLNKESNELDTKKLILALKWDS